MSYKIVCRYKIVLPDLTVNILKTSSYRLA
jgi:hypothetical protein